MKVYWTETPIAPFGHGGEEYFGWKESPSDPDRDPFPIRMIPFVDIVGVKSTSGERPKITIWEEDPSGVFLGNFTKWSDFDKPRRALVHAASNSKLLRIDLDGELYLRKNTDRIKAVWAEDVVAFEVRDCVARRLYDGIYFFANHDGTVQASVVDCTISEFFPFLGASSVVEEQGHAGLWLEGAPGPGAPSSLVVDVSGCTFTGSHDGLEVIGKDTTTAVLDLTDCDFIENENGLEVVGTGDLQFLATDCRFIRNHNIDGGTPLLLNEIPHSTAGIAFRGMRVMGAVRNCYFENNGYGILWLPHTTPALPELDLGTHATTDPGGNVFELDFGAFPAGEELLRVCLYNSDVSGDSEIVAVGNTWYHDNGNGHQGASSTGELTGFFQGDPNDGLNLTHEDGPFPPGPMVGKCCDPSTSSDWLRNFSLKPNATVDFGP